MMLDYLEDCDGDDAILIPISKVRCCYRWVGKKQVFAPLTIEEKLLPETGQIMRQWQCPVCKGSYGAV